MSGKIADYDGGREPHGDGVTIEEERLTDGSRVYNVAVTGRAGDGVLLRFHCVSEEAAWQFADDLDRVSGVTIVVPEALAPADPAKTHLRDVAPDQADRMEAELRRIATDDRYPARLKIWMALKALRGIKIDEEKPNV